MKLCSDHNHQRQHERGSSVFILIVMLSLMLMFITANTQTLFRLHGEMRIIERRQANHWNSANDSTNRVQQLKPVTP